MATSFVHQDHPPTWTDVPVGIIAVFVFGVWLRVSARLASTTRCAHYTAIRLIPNRLTPCLVTRPALLGARRGPVPRWQSPRRREPRLSGCPSRGLAWSRGSPEPVCDWEPGRGGSAGSLRRWVVDVRRWVGRASVPGVDESPSSSDGDDDGFGQILCVGLLGGGVDARRGFG